MRLILDFLWGSTIRSVVTGIVMTGFVFWGAQYLGDVPPDENSTFSERVKLSVNNLKESAQNVIDIARSPASVFHLDDSAQIKTFVAPTVISKNKTDKSSAINHSNNNRSQENSASIDPVFSKRSGARGQKKNHFIEQAPAIEEFPSESSSSPTEESAESRKPTQNEVGTSRPSNKIIYAVSSSSNSVIPATGTDASVVPDGSLPSSSMGVKLFVYSDKSSGTYGANISVTLSANSATASIKYCLQLGSCCDPMSSGTTYSAPITVTDGNYCLSAISYDGASISEITNFTYLVDSTLPDVSQTVTYMQFQSNEINNLQVTSSDMGIDGFTLTQLNLVANDPTSMTCSDILLNYPSTTYGLLEELLNDSVINMGGGRSPASVFNFPLTNQSISYGDNFLVSIVEDNTNIDGPIYSCPTTKVVLKDFEIYSSQKSVAQEKVIGSDSSTLQGGFAPYGGFNATLNQSSKGRVQVSGSAYLESGIYNIVN
jgi:hypothetical protein